jgi:hypothetical protein
MLSQFMCAMSFVGFGVTYRKVQLKELEGMIVNWLVDGVEWTAYALGQMQSPKPLPSEKQKTYCSEQ